MMIMTHQQSLIHLCPLRVLLHLQRENKKMRNGPTEAET